MAEEPIFEEVGQHLLKARSEAATTPEHYNDLGVRKYDLTALLRRIRDHFRGPSTTNPKLVSYLAAGGIQGLRPLRYEKSGARNRFIVFVILLFVVLLGTLLAFHNRHYQARPESESRVDVQERRLWYLISQQGHVRLLSLSPGGVS